MDSQASVNSRFGIPGQVQFVTRGENFVVAEVTNAHATAAIALQGAHVMTWTPRGQQPVIWMSEVAKLAAGKSIRGGVPICWPWFGPHATDASKPGHGPARTVPWNVVETKALPNGATRLTFEMAPNEAVKAMWPHATPVRAVITVGAELTVELVTRNEEKSPVTIGEALHTYFQVSDIGKVRIDGLAGVSFVDKVENSARKVQQGAITIGSEVDRVYTGTAGECVIVDEGYGRRIRIAKEGSRSTVVWNPWVEKANKMGDLGENGYRHMLCVESGNALDDVVSIPAGGEHRMTAIYRVEKM